jgi:hypothetical protein
MERVRFHQEPKNKGKVIFLLAVTITIITSLTILPGTGFAQEKYPSKPINFWIGYPAGGTTDVCARPLVAAASKILGQPIVVVNNLTKEIGETIIAIEEMKFDKGFIITKIKEEIQPLIKNTSLEKFKMIDEKDLWPIILGLKIERKKDFLMFQTQRFTANLSKSMGF